MFQRNSLEDRASLKISEYKTIKTLKKTDQDIFIRDYFKNISENLTGIIANDYLKFEKDDKAQPFFTALFTIREHLDAKDIFASFRSFEDDMIYVYESIYSAISRNENHKYGLLNIKNFCFSLGLIIDHFYPDNDISDVDSINLGHSAKDHSERKFMRIQLMVNNPLEYIIKLEKNNLTNEIRLFLIDNRSLASEELDKILASKLPNWVSAYPRVEHSEAIEGAIEKCNRRGLKPKIPLLDIQSKLLSALKELQKPRFRKSI